MTSTSYAVKSGFSLTLALFAFVTMLFSIACSTASNAPDNTTATPANVAIAAKPAETQTQKPDEAPVGKEIKPADGPKLKSIEPVEGTILGGVLNELATSLPQPDPDAAKTANASGTVTVEVVVNEKGEVSASSVVSGPQPLWSAAGAAARKARFDPPLFEGKPVKVAGVLTYEFKK
ncbi:MAG: TonB family protein [Pyrinomonadaceae bacterium]